MVEDYDQVSARVCAWAWSNLYKMIAHLALGGDFPWVKQPGAVIRACSNVLAPVFFEFERV
jgi:uncharacterized repeat protein (TIGR04076 family)